MRIGIDIDDTIADTYEVAFAYAQRYTINELGRNDKIRDDAITHHCYLKIMHDWSDEEEEIFWKKYYGEMLEKARPFTFSIENINKLKEEGNEIFFITARWPMENSDILGITLEWLKKNNVNYDKLIMNVKEKAKVVLDEKIDLFIDDSFKNCTEVAYAGVKTYIIETRMNKKLKADNVTRVYSWSDIYSRIKKEEM